MLAVVAEAPVVQELQVQAVQVVEVVELRLQLKMLRLILAAAVAVHFLQALLESINKVAETAVKVL
jgi:hypothetical protein